MSMHLLNRCSAENANALCHPTALQAQRSRLLREQDLLSNKIKHCEQQLSEVQVELLESEARFEFVSREIEYVEHEREASSMEGEESANCVYDLQRAAG